MTDEPLALRALLGSTERRGAWTVPSRIDAHVVLGSMQLDLCDAQLGEQTTIDADVSLGSLEIFVPCDVVVDVDVHSFAATVAGGRGSASDGVRRLRVIGNVRFGSCDVIACERGPT